MEAEVEAAVEEDLVVEAVEAAKGGGGSGIGNAASGDARRPSAVGTSAVVIASNARIAMRAWLGLELGQWSVDRVRVWVRVSGQGWGWG